MIFQLPIGDKPLHTFVFDFATVLLTELNVNVFFYQTLHSGDLRFSLILPALNERRIRDYCTWSNLIRSAHASRVVDLGWGFDGLVSQVAVIRDGRATAPRSGPGQ
ncbi:hypothetical protein SCOR_34870 [Sulfidibacter corallicola]